MVTEMDQPKVVTGMRLRTPQAGAAAGIVFSILLITIFWLLRTAVPPEPLEAEAWLSSSSASVSVALNLVPFAGIAFLWFLGALRDRLGTLEDQFFATVFFGSALLFLAMLFTAAAAMGALILAFVGQPSAEINSATTHFARATAYLIMNVYAIKMAAVFMISTSTVIISTSIVPRWIAIVGFALAVLLLLGSQFTGWSFMVMPFWVFLVSSSILLHHIRQSR